MRVPEAVRRASRIPGYMSKQELTFLASLAASQSLDSRWAEIGTFCGRSLLAIGLTLPRGSTLVSVDFKWGSTRQAGISAHDVFQEIVQDRGKSIDLHVIRSTSEQSATTFADGSFDVIFVDAAHDYENVARDIAAWRPKLRAGGTMCGHDFTNGWPGVKRAVTEAFGDVEVEQTIWVKRPESI